MANRIKAGAAVRSKRGSPKVSEAAIARLRPALDEWLRAHGAHPGICTDESASPRRSARAEVELGGAKGNPKCRGGPGVRYSAPACSSQQGEEVVVVG